MAPPKTPGPKRDAITVGSLQKNRTNSDHHTISMGFARRADQNTLGCTHVHFNSELDIASTRVERHFVEKQGEHWHENFSRSICTAFCLARNWRTNMRRQTVVYEQSHVYIQFHLLCVIVRTARL